MGAIASQITSLTSVYSTFIQAQIKENIKASRHWPLGGKFTGDRWIPHTNSQSRGKCFHLMTSSWDQPTCISLGSVVTGSFHICPDPIKSHPHRRKIGTASHRVKLGMLAPVGGCRHLILLDVSNCACLQRIVLFAGRGSSSAHPKSTDIKANEIYRQVSNIRSPKSQLLTHWGRDKMAAIFQTTFSHAFSWMKMNDIRLKFHWNLFLMFQLTIFQHWFR